MSLLLLTIPSCKREKEALPKKPAVQLKPEVEADTTAPMVKDTNRIATDPFISGDYEFAKTPDVFRERFNAFMKKLGWEMRLKKGEVITVDHDIICNMPLTEHINIAAKLGKNDAVVKVVLFSSHDFNVPSQMEIVHAMKGMIAAGPAYRYITDDEIEIIMYGLGTLSDDKIFPKGIYKRDGIRYEVKVNLSNIYFGVSAE
ncbi:hypothetical protein [Flavobacterium psychrotrophum]|uniref:hypothetical protein n=1 Tax=Flavobacterium psychrotrophum TaxID=2294119 RepID=UPI000E312291|nr:hypothetical protein [Flavobacterium psychrotrophum]